MPELFDKRIMKFSDSENIDNIPSPRDDKA